MRNYVIWLRYRLSGDSAAWDAYGAIGDLSWRSCMENLTGPWESKVLYGDYRHLSYERAYSAMYRDLFEELRRLHAEGHNVLHLDPDVLCVKPTNPWLFEEMRLFWHTDPPARRHFDPYLNAGIVYIPASMDPDLWHFADAAPAMAEWNDSQDIFNEMFYAQDPVPPLCPQLNWSPNVPSPIREDRAHLVHFNSTRGATQVLDQMTRAWRAVQSCV